jgi:putative methyltransferase (TIGR04325 family)
MKDIVRTLARRALPRAVLRPLRRWRAPAVRYSDGYSNWHEAQLSSGSYDDPEVVERVASAARKVRQGHAVYERDSVLFSQVEYSWPVLTGLMYAAARRQGRLAVLDFGGSLGSTYMQNRLFLRGLDVNWCIVDLPRMVAMGRSEFETPTLHFFETIAQAAASCSLGAIHLGGSLQFVEHPLGLLQELAAIPHDVLVLDRTPFTDAMRDFICVQHVKPPIYTASYPFHVFSTRQFEDTVRDLGWKLLEWFPALESDRETDSGQRLTFRGAVLERVPRTRSGE